MKDALRCRVCLTENTTLIPLNNESSNFIFKLGNVVPELVKLNEIILPTFFDSNFSAMDRKFPHMP